MEQFIGLISKVSIVLVFIFTSVIIGERFGANREKILGFQKESGKFSDKYIHQILQGVMFSFLIIIEMLTAFSGPNGIRYDARVVLLNLSATYGPISGAITAFTGIAIRMSKGTNYPIAISSIVFVYILELIFLSYEKKKGVKNYSKWIYLMSILTNIINGIYIIMVSAEEWKTAMVPAITYVVAYPLFTLVAYNVMCYIKSRGDLLRELSDRDLTLQIKNEELSKINENLKENEFRLRKMFSNSGDAIVLIEDFKIAEINLKALELLGYYNKGAVVGKEFEEFILEVRREDEDKVSTIREVLERVMTGESLKVEVVIQSKDGRKRLLEVFMVDIKVPDAEYIYTSARDISARKRREGEILYKARHDALTRVANRQYFEETMAEITGEARNYPIAYMMADINGLKLVNDVFGHAEGDRLIVKVAETLTKCCRNSDMIARVGGDEFVVLFTKADENVVESVMERVRSTLKKEKVDTIEPSLSMGYAIKDRADDGFRIEDMAKRADEMMYRNKTADRKRNVRIFLDNMINRLYEESPEEREMAFKLTKYLDRIRKVKVFDGVTKREISKLIRYTNIGKLVTEKQKWKTEWNDIGDMKFSEELLEASAGVLEKISHLEEDIIGRKELFSLNERWDGSGAMGLREDEISLSVRAFQILSDFCYVLDNKNLFDKQSEDEVFEYLLCFAGKKYDKELLLEIREELLSN